VSSTTATCTSSSRPRARRNAGWPHRRRTHQGPAGADAEGFALRRHGLRFDFCADTGAEHHASAEHEGHLRAPMPGLVLDVRAEAGTIVEAGTVLVVLEAMKMGALAEARRGVERFPRSRSSPVIAYRRGPTWCFSSLYRAIRCGNPQTGMIVVC